MQSGFSRPLLCDLPPRHQWSVLSSVDVAATLMLATLLGARHLPAITGQFLAQIKGCRGWCNEVMGGLLLAV
jgi:hypothetical protein